MTLMAWTSDFGRPPCFFVVAAAHGPRTHWSHTVLRPDLSPDPESCIMSWQRFFIESLWSERCPVKLVDEGASVTTGDVNDQSLTALIWSALAVWNRSLRVWPSASFKTLFTKVSCRPICHDMMSDAKPFISRSSPRRGRRLRPKAFTTFWVARMSILVILPNTVDMAAAFKVGKMTAGRASPRCRLCRCLLVRWWDPEAWLWGLWTLWSGRHREGTWCGGSA